MRDCQAEQRTVETPLHTPFMDLGTKMSSVLSLVRQCQKAAAERGGQGWVLGSVDRDRGRRTKEAGERLRHNPEKLQPGNKNS